MADRMAIVVRYGQFIDYDHSHKNSAFNEYLVTKAYKDMKSLTLNFSGDSC